MCSGSRATCSVVFGNPILVIDKKVEHATLLKCPLLPRVHEIAMSRISDPACEVGTGQAIEEACGLPPMNRHFWLAVCQQISLQKASYEKG